MNKAPNSGKCGGMLLAVALLVWTQAAPVHAASTLNAQAHEILAENFSEDGPGAAVAVLKNGRLVVEAHLGLADIERGIAINSNTVFDLASVSKQFTAASVLLLEADGEIDLNRAIKDYLPDYRVRSPGRPVRVSDLVLHVSGLPDYCSDDFDENDNSFGELTTETHLQWLNTVRPRGRPGISYVYNNSGYALLSLLIERVSGQSYANFVSERLFLPAGMRRTRVMDDATLHFPHQTRGYKSDEDGNAELSEEPSSTTGDGNVYSNLKDMIAWMRALDGDAVLSAAQKRRAFAPGKLDSGAMIEDEGEGYGYGWVIEAPGRVSHSGSWRGTATFIARDRKEALSVVVLSNDESADVASIAAALAELVR